MQGILIVNKPQDFTSFDVVAKLRGICATRKIGHGGTLDPMATGVLPVFIGGAVKAVDMQTNETKAYTATLRLGLRTDTGDITGIVQETAPVTATEQDLLRVLPQFVGAQQQLPPMYSAVKINGQPLYKAARRGETVQRTPRSIEILSIEYLGCPAPNDYTLHIRCSKGTYIRTLLEDIGAALGTPATMSALCRTQNGPYTLEKAYTFAEIQAAKDNGTLQSLLISVDSVFLHLPSLTVTDEVYARLLNGAPTYRFHAKDGQYRIYHANAFAGIATVQDKILRSQKLFVERE